PKYIEDFKDAYPLNLVAIADKYTLNTMFGSREDIVKKRGEMKVLINPEDARARNIHSGDLVCIYNDLSSISCKAEVIDTISAGCAGISGVYESSHNGETIQLNSLHHPRLSDIGAGTTLNGNYVEIKRK
ncbi:MAG: dehydrogenase, partial [Firmicutes bacterium]|nr:dehydrogenase [Bacillota bacterium]